ncbi:SUA5/yciO/yrdC domain protein [Thalassoporum mexicanum PCC 7367]|uniref:L-threonylcarbamoyladenylate synthase n=1 Tax=Thalassoporum mexicanum TaxID=3457544 RepID=UPI00029FE21C|nr:L-threonylcarbamoyladenylate synthase [Pseudanabaena sp. PCC 7367]AFY69931.1 SUA5/yciO/yrdC domain protein [Pseudanabaena sp. PCC 7367]
MALVSMAALVTGARSGQVVSFPTDTVPALAAIGDRASSIYKLKDRPSHKPLILMAAQLTDFLSFIDPALEPQTIDKFAQLAEKHWPGALTIILPASELGRSLNVNMTTIGMRIPADPVAIAILQQTGPLLTTSANLSGAAPIDTTAAIAAQFPTVLALGEIPDTYDPNIVTGSGQPSTVIEWSNSGWLVRRQGQIAI